jgi:hypothetical protein
MKNAEQKYKSLYLSTITKLAEQQSIMSQLGPMLAACSASRSVLVLLRQLQQTTDSALTQVEAIHSQVADVEHHDTYVPPVLNAAHMWGQFEAMSAPPDSTQATETTRPPRPKGARANAPNNAKHKQRRQNLYDTVSLASHASSNRVARPSWSRPLHAVCSSQRKRPSCAPRRVRGRGEDNGKVHTAKSSVAAPMQRLLHSVAYTARCAQEEAALATAALASSQQELQAMKDAAAAAPSSAVLLAAVQAAESLEASNRHSSHVRSLRNGSPPPHFRGRSSSESSQVGLVNHTHPLHDDSTSLRCKGRSLSETSHDASGSSASSQQPTNPVSSQQPLPAPAMQPNNPPVRTPVGQLRRKGGGARISSNNRPSTQAPATLILPNLRADDDDNMACALPQVVRSTKPASSQEDRSAILAQAASTTTNADMYVSSHQAGSTSSAAHPVARNVSVSLDADISALEQSLAALGISNSSSSHSSQPG